MALYRNFNVSFAVVVVVFKSYCFPVIMSDEIFMSYMNNMDNRSLTKRCCLNVKNSAQNKKAINIHSCNACSCDIKFYSCICPTVQSTIGSISFLIRRNLLCAQGTRQTVSVRISTLLHLFSCLRCLDSHQCPSIDSRYTCF